MIHVRRGAWIAVTVAVAALAPLAAAPVWAQAAPDSSREVRTQEQREQERRKAAAAARQADKQKLLEGEDVSFAQILADPDNIDLNFAYAKTQIRRGDVRAASATLERILLIAPDLPRVRLLYAIVLFRLDNLDEAERELKAVLKLDMPDSLRVQLKGYLGQIEQRRKRTKFSYLVNIGYQWDWNRTQSPSSKQISTFAGRILLEPVDGRQSDTSIQGYTSLGVEHDLGFQARHRVFGSVSYYHGDQTSQKTLTLQSLNFEAGGVYDLNPVSITATGRRRNIRLSHERFINTWSGKLRGDYRWRSDTNLFASWQSEAQQYYEIHESRAAKQQTGPEHRASVGLDYIIGPAMRITGQYTRLRKEAKVEFNEYRSDILALDHTWLLGQGLFLLSHFSWRVDLYDGNDPLISVNDRRDAQYRWRTTLGVPLSALLFNAVLPEMFDGITFTFTGEMFRSTSNITNFQYWNKRAAVSISKRWEF